MMEVGAIVPLPKLLAIDGESLIALEVWNKLQKVLAGRRIIHDDEGT